MSQDNYPKDMGWYLYRYREVDSLQRLKDWTRRRNQKQQTGYLTDDSDIWFWAFWKEFLATGVCLLVTIQVVIWRTFFRPCEDLQAASRESRTRSESSGVVMVSVKSQASFAETDVLDTTGPAAEFVSRYLTDFEPLRCLGRGGFGIVYESRNKLDDCRYAVKRVAVPNNDSAKEKVMREVKALAKLDHVGIVRYYQAWFECPPRGWQERTDTTILQNCGCLEDNDEPEAEEEETGCCGQPSTSAGLRSPPIFSGGKNNPSSCTNDEDLPKLQWPKGLDLADSGLANGTGTDPNFSAADSESNSILFERSEVAELKHSVSSGAVRFQESSLDESHLNGGGKMERNLAGSSRKSKENKVFGAKIEKYDSVVFQESSGGRKSEDNSNLSEADTNSNFILFQNSNKDEQTNVDRRKMNYSQTPELKRRRKKNFRVEEQERGNEAASTLDKELQTPLPRLLLYIQMQLCSEQTLRHWLQTNSQRDRPLLLNWFHQIVSAVEYVHNSSLIHRDLKPSNTFFALNGQIKIGDFGLVTQMASELVEMNGIRPPGPWTGSGTGTNYTDGVGTHLYMSPEQVRN